MWSFSLPPSSFHDSLSVSFFFPYVLCSEWHHSSPLAIWLPGGFNQWQAQTGAWRMRGDEDVFITLCLCPCSLPALTLVWLTVFCYDLGSHQTTFLPHLQLPSCFRNVMLSSCFLRLRVENGFPLLLFPKTLPCWLL